MNGEIGEAKAAVTEALDGAERALDLTFSLKPLHEDAFAAGQVTYRSLEAAACGLSRFLEKNSLAAQAGVSSAGGIESANRHRESAIEAGKEASVEIGLALTGFTTIVSKTKDMQSLVSGKSGAHELLGKSARIVGSIVPEGHRIPMRLSQSVTHIWHLSHQLKQGLDAVTQREIPLSNLAKQLKEAVILLVDTKNKSVDDFVAGLKTVRKKVTSSDLRELSQVIEDVDAIKNHYGFNIPGEQRDLQKSIRRAIKDSTEYRALL